MANNSKKKKKQHYGQHNYEVQTNYLRRTNKPANYVDLNYKSITKCCFNGEDVNTK